MNDRERARRLREKKGDFVSASDASKLREAAKSHGQSRWGRSKQGQVSEDSMDAMRRAADAPRTEESKQNAKRHRLGLPRLR